MHFEQLPIELLKPAPYNPRIDLKPGMPAYERLKRSLAEFELVQPIVWNRTTGHIVGGHQRWRILADRGDSVVDCIVVELPLAREQALNVSLNNSRVGGDWDREKLVDLLEGLQSLPDFDATLTGFDPADLKQLSFEPSLPGDATPATDDEPELVRIVLEVPAHEWPRVRTAFDAWLAEHPSVRTHLSR